jgi:hypothetical protein
MSISKKDIHYLKKQTFDENTTPFTLTIFIITITNNVIAVQMIYIINVPLLRHDPS